MVDREAALDILAEAFCMDSEMKESGRNGLNKLSDLAVIDLINRTVALIDRSHAIRAIAERRKKERSSQLESSFTD